MKINPDTGLLDGASYLDSPNRNGRPKGVDIDLLVIHNISLPAGEFGGADIEALFLNRLDTHQRPDYADLEGLKVSAHLLIRRDGEVLQFVPFHQRAWHAGVSAFAGREGCNDFSIGIELEGTDYVPFTDAQYQQLVAVTGQLMRVYPQITPARIVGHSEIAPGRKTDPGPAFDWRRFKESLRG